MKAFYKCRREPHTGKRMHMLLLPEDNSLIIYKESDDRFYFGLNAAEGHPNSGITRVAEGDVENSGYTPVEIDDRVIPAIIFGKCYRTQLHKAGEIPLDAELRPYEEKGKLLESEPSLIPLPCRLEGLLEDALEVAVEVDATEAFEPSALSFEDPFSG